MAEQGGHLEHPEQTGTVSDSTVSDSTASDSTVSDSPGGGLTYNGYLRLPELLGLQNPQTGAHDELLFITVHQTYELWFKQLLHELEAARDAMFDGRLWWSRHTLTRVRTIERVLVQQNEILLTLTPQDFLPVRRQLVPANDFRSVQYRELEFLSGAKDPAFLARARGLDEAQRHALQRRFTEPSLWDAFISVVERVGLPAGPDDIVDSMVRVARDRSTYGEVWDVAEGLIDHDEAQVRWRTRQILMLERQTGSRGGIGGAEYAGYLQGRLPMRYYPALWELRNRL